MILVTGGTGLLGQHLLERLTHTDEPIRVLCRKPPDGAAQNGRVEWHVGDVTQPESLTAAMRGISHVYHLAGRVDFNPRDPSPLLEVNRDGTRCLLTAAERAGVRRVVHVSSVSTIGGTRDPRHPLNEDDFGMGEGTDLPYPASKLAGERVALEFAARGLTVVIVNPTFFCGPGDVHLSSARTIVSFVRRQVWVGLTRGGMGYTDVRDIAAGVFAAMQRGQPGRRYILGGTNLLLHEYHALLADLTGIRAPFLRVPPWAAQRLAILGNIGYRMLGIKTYVNAGDVQLARHYWFYDYTRCRNELGLAVRTPRESLRDTLEWLKQAGVV